MLRSVAAKEGENVYAQYADYREPVLRAAVIASLPSTAASARNG